MSAEETTGTVVVALVVAMARIEADLRERFPVITELFLHASSRRPVLAGQVGLSTPAASRASSVPPSSTR